MQTKMALKHSEIKYETLCKPKWHWKSHEFGGKNLCCFLSWPSLFTYPLLGGSSIMVIADGCNWGDKPKEVWKRRRKEGGWLEVQGVSLEV